MMQIHMNPNSILLCQLIPGELKSPPRNSLAVGWRFLISLIVSCNPSNRRVWWEVNWYDTLFVLLVNNTENGPKFAQLIHIITSN